MKYTKQEILKSLRMCQIDNCGGCIFNYHGCRCVYSLLCVAEKLIEELTSTNFENMHDKINIVVDKCAFIPKRAHDTDAGIDLYSPVDSYVPARQSVCIDTGVHIELPVNTVGMLKIKSGLNVKHGITSEGVIDVGYTGSIVAKLYNHSDKDYKISKGDKITQLVILPILTTNLEQVESLEETERGNGGFGSTGK